MNASRPFQIDEAPVEGAENTPAMSNAMVFLALYLILLGFFIVLNAQAEISEQRAKAVVQGLQQQFILPVASPDQPAVLVSDRLEAELAEIFRHNLTDDAWQLQTQYGEIIIHLPQRRVFPADSAVLQPGRIAMFRRLSTALNGIPGLGVTVTVGTAEDQSLTRRRAAALGRDLTRFGVPAETLSVGLAQSAGDDIRIHLKLPNGEG